MNIYEYIAHKRKIIDTALDRYLPSVHSKPYIIHRAMRYAVFSNGKRIRPVLSMAGFEACRGRSNLIIPVACGLELIHTYTLIHDDLPCMDDDDFRRGRPSCHKRFGDAVALLAGDGLLTLAFRVLSEAKNILIIREVSDAVGTFGTIGGQAMDIKQLDMTKAKIKNKKELNYIVANKTAALFAVSLKAAGILKGADKKKIKCLSDFGRNIGFTFQLIDDIIDGDGYAKIYGSDYTRRKAGYFTKMAKGSLKIFEDKARRLLEIADLILNRTA